MCADIFGREIMCYCTGYLCGPEAVTTVHKGMCAE